MLSAKQKLGWFGIATCSLALATTPAQAGTLFNQSQTGIDLFNNPNVNFPTMTPSLNGNSIDFGPGPDFAALLVWDLLPAAPRGDLDVSISIDYTALTGDNDPIFALFDGNNFLALARQDNENGRILLARGSASVTEILDSTVDATPLVGLGPVEPFSYDLQIADGGAGPASISNFMEGADSTVGTFTFEGNFINTDNALSFVVYRENNFPEQYRINSIAISIEDKSQGVPEPSAILGMVGAIGLGFLRHKMTGKR